jgi:hypothetical protein
MTITLLDLRTQTRQRADLETSKYVTDSELNGLINDSIAELQDLLIATYDGDYFVESVQFDTVSGQTDYPLPDGTLYSSAPAFYKLKGVDAKIIAGNFFALRPFNFNERNRNEDYAWGFLNGPTIRYRIVGDNLRFSPAPNSINPIRVWYIPTAQKLVADSDVLKDVNAYHEYVVIDAAIKCRIKEELDIAPLEAMKAQMAKRITEMAQNRDVGQPESVSDIYAENDDYYFYRS